MTESGGSPPSPPFLRTSLGEFDQLVYRCRVLSERVAQQNKRVKAEEQALCSETKILYTEIRQRQASARENGQTGGDDYGKVVMARKLFEGGGPGGDLRVLDEKTRQTPFLLSQLLGIGATGCIVRPDQRLELKQEYYMFRRKAAILFTVAPALLWLGLARAQGQIQGFWNLSLSPQVLSQASLSPPLWVAIQAYTGWLAYFYISLALRENVLVMNGSDIRPWWIQHHYVMVLMSFVVISLPTESAAFQLFAKRFLTFNIFQGLIMMFQNRYQTKRLYRQIALGRNNAMDVVTGEGSAGKGQLLLLYPALFALQGIQGYVGARAVTYSFRDVFQLEGWLDEAPSGADLRGSRGVFICGVLFLVLALGNLSSTVATIVSKVKKSRRRQKGKQKNV